MLSLLLFAQASYAQKISKDLDKRLTQFKELHKVVPVEKVFLHLDKTQYGQGETIWLKSYLTAGADHLPSMLSNNVYVELLTPQGEFVDRIILRSEEGLAHGSLKLDKQMVQGEYYLRAYTEYMKNQGSDFFYTKKIKVYSLDRAELPVTVAEDKPLELLFYPEGGHLVRHVASRMAFEVRGGSDDEVYSGTIYNAKNRKITSFSTTHEGRGLVSFVPKDGAGYYAKLDGSDQNFPLPDIDYTGVIMSVNNTDEDYVKITVKNSKTNKDTYHIVAHTRGYITFASQIRLKGNRTFTRIDKSTLPEGITHITLFDPKMRPMADRLVFINQDKGLNIDVRSNKPVYGPRELATVGFTVTDEKGKPVEGSFSLSAFDAISENDQLSHNIRTHLLLNSDVKGHIKNPSQYFTRTKEAEKNLDLLMMVKGWSRFDWKSIPDYMDQELYPAETGLTISGNLSRENDKKLKDGKVFLMNNATKAISTPLALTDDDGNFRFDNQIFYDTTQLIFQGFHKKGFKNVSMVIDTLPADIPLNTYPTPESDYNPVDVDILKFRTRTYVTSDSVFDRRNGYTDLGTVTVESRKEGTRDARIDGTLLTTTDFTEIPYEERKKKDPYRVMIGRVPGLMFGATTGLSGNSDVAFMEPRFGMGQRWNLPPRILIDGVDATFDEVYGLPSTHIDYVLSVRGNPGLISIYTLSAEKYNEITPKPGLFVKNLPGYHIPDEFYAPRYEEGNEDQDLSDQRTTLFWSPMITTDKNGEAMFSFYTPDQTTRVIVDVQGISTKGNAGAGSLSFETGKNE
ncbi:MAG: hypothetical protein Roseis2KO_45520 [Roseivirga sp.]